MPEEPKRVRLRLARTKPRLMWSPQWEGTIQTWAKSFIQKNRWRCDTAINDFDDLLQDAYLVFLKISDKYPRVIEPRHFMALFKTAMWNQLHDKARYVRLKRQVHEETSVDVAELCSQRIGECTNPGYLGALLAGASEELKRALILLQQNVAELYEPQQGPENLNMKLRRVMHSQGFNFVQELTSLLTHEG